jgi:hypothetical protein
MGERRNVYRVLMGKLEREISLGRPRHKREGKMKMEAREIGWGSVDWIHLARYRDQ